MNIDHLEYDLLRIEREIENLANGICSEKESGPTWQSLNRAVGEIRSAVISLRRMRQDFRS